MSKVYAINKGVNRPVVFRGLCAQYIWWLGSGLAVLFLVFAVLYLLGVGLMVCVVFVGGAGALLFYLVYRFNKEYGEHGWTKAIAKKRVPKRIICDKLL